MSEQPLVSVVVPFLDAQRFLDESVRSVLAQTWQNWELLLVDDGSSDGSAELAAGHAATDPRIRCLHHADHANRGISASRNLGLGEARGTYLALLDADDVLLPEKLETQVGILEAHPRAAMVYGKSLYWYRWGETVAETPEDRVQPHWIEGDRVVEPPRLVGEFITGRAAVPSPCSVMARTSAVRDIGGFEEDFPGMYEDQVFFTKMCMTHPVYVSDTCLDWYRQHPESISRAHERAGTLIRARRRFLDWLATELERRGVEDADVWEAVRRETWKARKRPGSGTAWESRLRWLEKWMLRVEDTIVPAGLRRRIWQVRVPATGSESRPGQENS